MSAHVTVDRNRELGQLEIKIVVDSTEDYVMFHFLSGLDVSIPHLFRDASSKYLGVPIAPLSRSVFKLLRELHEKLAVYGTEVRDGRAFLLDEEEYE